MARFNLMARLPMARLLGGSCMRLSAGAPGARTDPKEGTEMALKDVEIRALKPGERVYKCTDSNGLYVEAHLNGSKLWRHKFSHLGKDTARIHSRVTSSTILNTRNRPPKASWPWTN